MKCMIWIVVMLLLSLSPGAHAADAPATQQPVTLDTGTGQLAGTLMLPARPGRVPVVLIIAGSGPTDRDGNSAMLAGHNDSLLMLARALAAHGWASVRYDKRGIAASAAAGPAEAALRFDTYVDDAAAWMRQLKGDPRFSAVAVAGHSEGSLIGMLAARRENAAAFISLSGPARGAADTLRAQLRPRLPGELAQVNEAILLALEQGKSGAEVPAVPPALATLYRPSVQPYLASWFRYVPAREFAQLAMPLLIVQGTTDIQVAVSDAEALKQANPRATLAVMPGMNHVLKMVPADAQSQQASYGDPALPLAPLLAQALASFLGKLAP